jgi:hypothetical protein
MKIKQLLEKKIHFSVIQYYSWLITQPTETHKIYELLYIDPKPNKEPKMIFEEMDEESIKLDWFNVPIEKNFEGQIICWSDAVSYGFR